MTDMVSDHDMEKPICDYSFTKSFFAEFYTLEL